jgi:hypothetical protein
MPGIGATDPANLEAQACVELGFSRVVCDEEGDGNGSKSNGDKGDGDGEGKQQSTSDGIGKGGRWLARECRRGNHTTMTVGNDERQEHAADDDGSDKEGKGGKGHGVGSEGGG